MGPCAQLVFRVLVGFAMCGLGAACAESHRCDRIPWRDRKTTKPPVQECVQRLAADVCTWSAAYHEARRAQFDRWRAEEEAAKATGGNLLHESWESRCDCVVEPISLCFFAMTSERDGDDRVDYYIATGAPGCDGESEPTSASKEAEVVTVSGARCGAVGSERFRGAAKNEPPEDQHIRLDGPIIDRPRPSK